VSRSRQGVIEEILLGFIELPFWVSILGAAFFYITLRFGLPLLAGTSLIGTALATVFPSIAHWPAIAILAAGLIGVGKRHWKRLLLSQAKSPQALRQITWPDFELLVGEAYRRQGYSVRERGGRQPDGGVDLELVRGSEKVVVQCKQWLDRRVPVERVRELLGVVMAEGADRGILVATGGFTPAALEFAVGKPLQLLDAEALVQLTKTAGKPAAPAEDHEMTSAEAPICPDCGKGMVKKTARRGRTIGSQFWGCPSYPACRGTRAA